MTKQIFKLRESKLILALCVIASLFVIFRTWLEGTWYFPQSLADFFNNISLSIIASSIFYWGNVFYPCKRKHEIDQYKIKDEIDQLIKMYNRYYDKKNAIDFFYNEPVDEIVSVIPGGKSTLNSIPLFEKNILQHSLIIVEIAENNVCKRKVYDLMHKIKIDSYKLQEYINGLMQINELASRGIANSGMILILDELISYLRNKINKEDNISSGLYDLLISPPYFNLTQSNFLDPVKYLITTILKQYNLGNISLEEQDLCLFKNINGKLDKFEPVITKLIKSNNDEKQLKDYCKKIDKQLKSLINNLKELDRML